MSEAEELLALHIKAEKLPPPVRELRFHPVREWRFDFCWPGKGIAAEVDGGNHMAVIHDGRPVAVGRHTQKDDYQKLNEAARMGWRVFRFTPAMVKSGEAIATIKDALGVIR